LKEEVEELKDQTDKLESWIEDIREKLNPFKCETLEEEMKVELFQAAMKKYTLVQLEEKLGNKFDLM
jgi:archaellum component FlaC